MFDALPKNNKAIIIDNFHSLKQETMTKVLEYARNNFEIVVIAFRNSYDPTKRLIEDSIIGFDDNVFQLYQFSYLERKQFITNICKTMGVESQNYDKVFKIYEATVSTSKILDFCDPEYALLLTENIIKNKNYEDRNISSAFSIAFTHSVENAFYSAGCESKIDDCLLLTSWLAKKLWKRKGDYLFNENFISESYNECQKNYGTITLKYASFFNLLIKSQIIEEVTNGYFRFRRRIYLSYFVGKQIAADYIGLEDDSVKELIKNIHDGINSDILLFVSYEKKDKELFLLIKNKLDEILPDVEPINFNSKNNLIFELFNSKDIEFQETKFVSKEEYEKEKDEEDKNSIPSAIESDTNDDLKESQSDSNLLRDFKLIEILAKASSGFNTLFTKSEREQFIISSINAALRITQKIFTVDKTKFLEFSNKFEEIKKEIKKISKRNKAIEKVDELIMSITPAALLYTYLTSVFTSFELVISDWVSSSFSFPIVSNLDDELLSNSIFKLYCCSHLGNFEKFKSTLAKCLSKYEPEKHYLAMLKQAVVLFMLDNVVGINSVKELATITGISYESLISMVPPGQIEYKH